MRVDLKQTTSTVPSPMERCSVELWQEIFTQACTDGGRTGCSLSLVSHRVREISTICRYNTIAVVGIRNIHTLSDVLKASTSKPVILHLFIAYSSAQPSEEISYDQTQSLVLPLQAIFSIAAPHVKTLYAYDVPHPDWCFRDESWCPIGFPRLEDVFIPFFTTDYDMFQCALPNLRRLHVDFYWDDTLEALAQSTPSVTDLRLTCAASFPALLAFLPSLFGIPSPEHMPHNILCD